MCSFYGVSDVRNKGLVGGSKDAAVLCTHPLLPSMVSPLEVQDEFLPHGLVSFRRAGEGREKASMCEMSPSLQPKYEPFL